MLSEFLKKLRNLEGIEVLGYGTHGKFKWIENFGEYPLEGIPDATKEDVSKVKDLLKVEGIKVLS